MSEDNFVLTVGQPFAEGITEWPHGRFEMRHWDGNLMMQICYSNLDEKELDAFHHNPIFQALYVEKGVIFFCFKIDGFMEWSDQAFSVGLIPAADNPGHLAPDGSYMPMHWVLVDSDTGLVRGMRSATMSPKFVRIFQRAIDQQLATPFDPMQYSRSVQDVYSRLRKSRDIAAAAFIRERAGVDKVPG